MKRIVTWILIADGSKARIARNDGPGHGVQAVAGGEFQGRNLPGREVASDRPGRSFDSAGRGRHAMEPQTDPHEYDKQAFLMRLAGFLDKKAKQGRYDRLVLVAPPRVLGYLRNRLSDAARRKVSAELGKDLTQVPLHQLADRLAPVLAV